MFCLRCGRKIAEGNAFCDECLKTAGQPLQESPYLSARIILPEHQPTPPKRTETRERKAERTPRRPRKLIAAVVLLSMLCTALAGVCGYAGVTYYKWVQDNRRSPVQTENLRLNEEVKTYASQVAELEERIEELAKQLDKLPTLEAKSNFVNAHVVFVENDGTNYYHCYECEHFKKQSYWAYSLNLAISEGYTPCPDCQ